MKERLQSWHWSSWVRLHVPRGPVF